MSEQGAPERIWLDLESAPYEVFTERPLPTFRVIEYTRSDICAALVEALKGLGAEVIGKGTQKLCFCKQPTHKCRSEVQCMAARTALAQVKTDDK